MKKHDFKKLAALGLAVGLTVASTASACCGKERDKSDSSELLSSLNKTEGFMLAGGGCGGKGKCGSASNSSGTRNSNTAMNDANQGATRATGGTYQGSSEGTQIQGGFDSDPTSSNYRSNQGGYNTQPQQQNWNQPQQQNQWNQPQQQNQWQQQNQTPEQRYRNYQQNAPRSSGSCGGVTTSSGFNT